MTLIKQIFADLSNCKSTISGHLSHLRHLRAILYFDPLSSFLGMPDWVSCSFLTKTIP